MFKAGLISVVLVAASAGAASQTAICDAMAARLKADAAFMTEKRTELPFDFLVKDKRIIEPAAADVKLDDLAGRFQLQGTLTDQLTDLVEYSNNVAMYSIGSAHMVVEESGSMGCQSFAFFRTQGGKAKGLPQPPPWMDGGMQGSPEDGTPISECYGSTGHLASMNGMTGFFASHSGSQGDFGSTTDFAPLRGGKWGAGCTLEVNIETRFSIGEIAPARNSALRAADLKALAPKIARAFRAGFEEEPLAYDAQPAPATAKAYVEAVRKGGRKLPDDDHSMGEFSVDTVVSMAFAGHGYLVRIAHPMIGWRDMGGVLVTFYEIGAHDSLANSGSVKVDEDPGKVQAIRVKPRP